MLQIQVALLCVRSLYLLLSRSGFQSGDREPFLEGCFYIYTIGISYTQSRYLIYTAALHLLYSSFRWGQARRQVLVFWGAQYIVGERFGFYCMFETNFLGPKNLRGQKNWGGHRSRMPPWLRDWMGVVGLEWVAIMARGTKKFENYCSGATMSNRNALLGQQLCHPLMRTAH